MGAGGAGTYPGGDNVIERTNRDVEAGAIPAVPGAGGGLSGAAGSTQTVSLDDAADGVPSQVHDYGIMDSSMTEILDTAQLDLAFGVGLGLLGLVQPDVSLIAYRMQTLNIHMTVLRIFI